MPGSPLKSSIPLSYSDYKRKLPAKPMSDSAALLSEFQWIRSLYLH